ncbi:ABC transporter permease [Clostridium sp. 19966]|uniref:ABC transporter permease n=1 Tax=Clostridium sp. 19966 TaxID=2768166 RepID=UPI0028DD75D9|nr:ABC transporter permease [Clostridium sp. 19966]MDT8718165.1 ABC transporter permease [Clostridium sp. 19966]
MKKHYNWNLVAGFILLGAILLLMAIGIFYTPYDPNKMNVVQKYQAPNFSHLMGTDNFGRDIFSRIISGAKATFFISISTVLLGTLIGVTLGAISGYFGGWMDEIIMRINDALTAFPGILLALALVTVLGQGKYQTILALTVIFIPSYCRITRGEFLQLKELEFVKSAKVFGASSLRIIFLHILPNSYPALLSAVTIGLSNAILSEAGLSFLGFGVQPPDPSWGRMLSESQAYLFNAPWGAIGPGITIVITVIAFNFIAEGLRKIYE